MELAWPLISIKGWMGANTILGPNPTSLVFWLKSNGFISQDDVLKSDLLFRETIFKFIIYKMKKKMIQKNVTLYYYVHVYIKWTYRITKKNRKKLNNENTNYIQIYNFFGYFIFINFFPNFKNIPIIYLKHYHKIISMLT